MKKQKVQLLVLLAVLLLFVIGYYVLKNYNNDQSEKKFAKEAEEIEYVTQVSTNEITAFSYVLDGDTLHFEKNGSDWNCSEYSDKKLDSTKVEVMLSKLQELKADSLVEDPGELSEYGLDAPSNVVTVKTSDKELTLTFGLKNAMTNQYYVTSSESDSLYLVNESVFTTLTKSIDNLVVSDTVSGNEGVSENNS